MRTVAVVVLLLGCLAAGSAHAEQCPGMPRSAPALAALDAEARLRFLEGTASAAAEHARKWQVGWASFYSVLTVGLLSASPAFGHDTRGLIYLNALKTGVGAGAVLFDMKVNFRLHRPFERLSGASVCAELARAERLLLAQEKGERSASHWRKLVIGVAFNVGIGIWGVVVYDQYTLVGTGVGAGIVASVLMIRTMPKEAGDALSRYRAGILAKPSKPSLRWGAGPSVGREGWGLRVGVEF